MIQFSLRTLDWGWVPKLGQVYNEGLNLEPFDPELK